jgi:hypothetical protein
MSLAGLVFVAGLRGNLRVDRSGVAGRPPGLSLREGLWVANSNFCMKTSDSAGLLRWPLCPTLPHHERRVHPPRTPADHDREAPPAWPAGGPAAKLSPAELMSTDSGGGDIVGAIRSTHGCVIGNSPCTGWRPPGRPSDLDYEFWPPPHSILCDLHCVSTPKPEGPSSAPTADAIGTAAASTTTRRSSFGTRGCSGPRGSR